MLTMTHSTSQRASPQVRAKLSVKPFWQIFGKFWQIIDNVYKILKAPSFNKENKNILKLVQTFFVFYLSFLFYCLVFFCSQQQTGH